MAHHSPECGSPLKRISLFDDDGWEDAVVHCPDCGYSISFRMKLVSRVVTTKKITVEDDVRLGD
jgi:DNA-directed RNA polymerase subunit M/transcription elongation factor TFIIS